MTGDADLGLPRRLASWPSPCSVAICPSRRGSLRELTKLENDLMGLYGDLMGLYGVLMGFYSDLVGFYGDLMGLYGDLMGY